MYIYDLSTTLHYLIHVHINWICIIMGFPLCFVSNVYFSIQCALCVNTVLCFMAVTSKNSIVTVFSCFQDSLSFPDDVIIGSDVKELIQGLLTEPSARLTCDGIKSHRFFRSTNWDELLSCKVA